MKKIITFVISLFVSAALFAADIEGPFLILSNAYNADGSMNYENIVKEARFAAGWDIPGIIWPQSNDAIDLCTKEERFAGMESLVKEWKENPKKTILTLGVSGDDTAEMLIYANEAERLAAEYGVDLILAARPPYYGKTEADVQEYFDALAAVAKRPVIIQTYVNDSCPTPSVEFLINLAQKYPSTYGWIKEESNALEANDRQIGEIAGKPAIKTVFSAWGGWQWLYQYRENGTAGLISERIAYSPIVSLVWKAMRNSDRKGVLTEAYAMYRLMIDQRFLVADSLRGYQLYYFTRLGIFDNMLSRVYVHNSGILSGTVSPDQKKEWKLETFEVTERARHELDKCYDDMLKFVKKHKRQ